MLSRGANTQAANTELRCDCGSLMARVTGRGIELKCRRCRRVVVVAADQLRSDWVRLPSSRGGLTAR